MSEGAAVAAASLLSSLGTLVLSKMRCFCKQDRHGSWTRGCGFTDHSLFDQHEHEVQIEKTTINGVEILYLKQFPTSRGEDEDESD